MVGALQVEECKKACFCDCDGIVLSAALMRFVSQQRVLQQLGEVSQQQTQGIQVTKHDGIKSQKPLQV